MDAPTDTLTLPAHSALLARDTPQPGALRAFYDHYLPLIAEFLSSTGATPRVARAYFPAAAPGEDGIGGGAIAVGFEIYERDIPMIAPLVDDIGDATVTLHRFDEARYARTSFTGPYEDLPGAWQAFTAAIESAGLTPSGPSFEEYVTMPGASAEPVTDLYVRLS